MTSRQTAKIYIAEYLRRNRIMPSQTEVAEFLNITQPAVYKIFQQLLEEGWLVRVGKNGRQYLIADSYTAVATNTGRGNYPHDIERLIISANDATPEEMEALRQFMGQLKEWQSGKVCVYGVWDSLDFEWLVELLPESVERHWGGRFATDVTLLADMALSLHGVGSASKIGIFTKSSAICAAASAFGLNVYNGLHSLELGDK